MDHGEEERREQKDEKSLVRRRGADRLAETLRFRVRAQAVRQRSERDDAVDRRRERVAEEEVEERMIGEEARGGRAGGKRQIDHRSVHSEREDALFGTEGIDEQ